MMCVRAVRMLAYNAVTMHDVEGNLSCFDSELSTVTRHLTTGIRSEKCVVRRFRRRANVIECTYTNLDSIA